MTLNEFTELLHSHLEKPFHLILPGGKRVPASFHITEVAHVSKKALDCGGRLHTRQTCQLQAWLGGDADHSLPSVKMAAILQNALDLGVFPSNDLDIEIEYEDFVLTQYEIGSFCESGSAIDLILTPKHSDCLAKSVCLPMSPSTSGPYCGCGPECCTKC